MHELTFPPLPVQGPAMTSPCPTWCEGFHGPTLEGTIHAAEVHASSVAVVTLIALTLANGQLSDPLMRTYLLNGEDGPSVNDLQAYGIRGMAQIFTDYGPHEAPGVNDWAAGFRLAVQLMDTSAEPCPVMAGAR